MTGLQPGDRVRELAGRRISSLEKLKSVLESLKIGGLLPIVIRRGDPLLKGDILVEEAP